MIHVQKHIDREYHGNVSAFARGVSASRPTVYRWIKTGSMWHEGRVWDAVTAAMPAPVTPSATDAGDRLTLAIERLRDCVTTFKSLGADGAAQDVENTIKELTK